jgi:predicted amidohydrolase
MSMPVRIRAIVRLCGALWFFLLLAGCGESADSAAAPAGRGPVRAFAVGNKLELRYAATYADFRDKMFALVDATHPRRAELVQAGADDVASHIRPRDPRAPERVLVAFPEDVALVAGLIGTRGEAARRATIHNGGAQLAFAALILNSTAQIDYYQTRFPGLPTVRYLLLALTDTFYRAGYETFRDIARTYGVYVAATWNVAPARRVAASEDAALVALLRDPDEAATRDYAYVAVSSDVYNTTFIFDPDGNVLVTAPDGSVKRSPGETDGLLRGSLNKAYLTEDEQTTLPLANGRVQDLDVIDTPVGRIGAVISKDAWMIDVNDRYEAKGANLLLQAEAYSDWAYVADPWQPDNFKAGGYAQLQRNPSVRYNITSSLTGNLYEITFDGQSAILGKRRKSAAVTPAWIGQSPDRGFLRIAPWITEDPGLVLPSLSLDERRGRLAEQGMHLLPGAQPRCAQPTDFGACENGYRESIIFADLALDQPEATATVDAARGTPTDFGASVRVSAPGARAIWPRVAAHAGRVFVGWQDARLGRDNIFLALGAGGGTEFVETRVSDNAPGTVVELRPGVAVSPDGSVVFVVWQEFCEGRDDECGRIKLARFDRGGRKLGPDVRVDSGADGVGKWNPAVAVTAAGDPVVAWIDERDPGPGNLRFEHVYFARGEAGGRSFGANVRVDSSLPVPAAAALDNKWSPALAVQGDDVLATWTDFDAYNWDIVAARTNSVGGFDPGVRVDDAQGPERLHDHPSLGVDQSGRVYVAWADRRGTEGQTTIWFARSDDGGATFPAHHAIDPPQSDLDLDLNAPTNQWHPRLAISGEDVVVVWQDNRFGDNDIFSSRSSDRGESFAPGERVDDSGDLPTNQSRPDLAIDDADAAPRTLFVVWEDDLHDGSQIRLARRRL